MRFDLTATVAGTNKNQPIQFDVPVAVR